MSHSMKTNVQGYNPSELSGLELLQKMGSGEIPKASIAKTIPMDVIEVEKGFVKFTATANEQLLNPLGFVHGGFASAVLDSVTACAVHSTLPAGVGYATTDLNIKMLKPVPRDVELIAEGRVINVALRIGVSEGVLKSKGGVIYAHATATCMILR